MMHIELIVPINIRKKAIQFDIITKLGQNKNRK